MPPCPLKMHLVITILHWIEIWKWRQLKHTLWHSGNVKVSKMAYEHVWLWLRNFGAILVFLVDFFASFRLFLCHFYVPLFCQTGIFRNSNRVLVFIAGRFLTSLTENLVAIFRQFLWNCLTHYFTFGSAYLSPIKKALKSRKNTSTGPERHQKVVMKKTSKEK